MRLTYPKIIHMTLAGVLTWLGLILGWPEDTFSVSPAYHYLEAVGPEWTWAAAFLASGLWGFWTIFRPSEAARWWSALLLASMHTLFGVLLALGSPISTGSGTYCLVALLGYGYLHLQGKRHQERG